MHAMEAPSDPRTRAQLALIGELGARLAGARVRFWPRGGWALDFLIGRSTRPSDERARAALRALVAPAGAVD